MIETVLAAVVTSYGVVGALASLLQLRRMRARRSSQDVSLAYLSLVGGGYLLWLAYGIAIENLPLILVDALGGAAILATLSIAVRLRPRGEGPARHRAPVRPRLRRHADSGLGA